MIRGGLLYALPQGLALSSAGVPSSCGSSAGRSSQCTYVAIIFGLRAVVRLVRVSCGEWHRNSATLFHFALWYNATSPPPLVEPRPHCVLSVAHSLLSLTYPWRLWSGSSSPHGLSPACRSGCPHAILHHFSSLSLRLISYNSVTNL